VGDSPGNENIKHNKALAECAILLRNTLAQGPLLNSFVNQRTSAEVSRTSVMNPIRASIANSIAARYGHDLPVVVTRGVGAGNGEQCTAYGKSKSITLFDQTTVRQGPLRAKSDERDVSTKMKCVICVAVGLIVGAWAAEAKHAQLVGQVGFSDVVRCISMGP
jgi:hypothetical protein